MRRLVWAVDSHAKMDQKSVGGITYIKQVPNFLKQMMQLDESGVRARARVILDLASAMALHSFPRSFPPRMTIGAAIVAD